jgi:hypothetical protein
MSEGVKGKTFNRNQSDRSALIHFSLIHSFTFQLAN